MNAEKKTSRNNVRNDTKKVKGKQLSPSEARRQRKASDDRLVNRIKIIFVSVIVVAIIGIIAGVLLATYKPTVASVGSEKIKLPEYNYFLSIAKMSLLNEFGIEDSYEEDSFWMSNIGGMTLLELAKENALMNAREVKISVAKAKEQGIKLEADDNDYVTYLINNLISSAGDNKALASENAKLNYGTTLNELKKIIELMILSEKYIDLQTADIEITDEEAQAKYDENVDDYDYATVRHILIGYEGTEDYPRTKEESEALAEDTLRRVNEGEDFAELVEELTEDTASISTGGEYTFTRNDGLVEPFTDWSFSANIGDTAIVEREFGYHIMEMLDREIMPFEDVKDYLVYDIRTEKGEEMKEVWANDPKYELKKNEKVYDGIS